MARIVAAVGLPHTPWDPEAVRTEGPDSEAARRYRRLAEHLEEAQPDLLVVFDSDHFVNFFYDKMPAFAIGIVPRAKGTPETWVKMPSYTVPVHEQFAAELFTFGIKAGFDLTSCQEFALDHSILVPLHFLTPRMHLPIVPVWIKGLAPPLPMSRRCLQLGQMVRQFIDGIEEPKRIAVIASGSFSLDVAGPKMDLIDTEWTSTLCQLIEEGRVADIVERATPERIAEAGNASGELLNWIALLGAIGPRRPTSLEARLTRGLSGAAMAAWHVD